MKDTIFKHYAFFFYHSAHELSAFFCIAPFLSLFVPPVRQTASSGIYQEVEEISPVLSSAHPTMWPRPHFREGGREGVQSRGNQCSILLQVIKYGKACSSHSGSLSAGIGCTVQAVYCLVEDEDDLSIHGDAYPRTLGIGRCTIDLRGRCKCVTGSVLPCADLRVRPPPTPPPPPPQ